MKRPEIKKLDKEFRFLIRNGNPCAKCGTTLNVQASHVFPVSTCGYILRWNSLNCITLCYRCHIHWWHKNPIEAMEWFVKKYGQGRLDALRALKIQNGKYLTPELVRLGWKAEWPGYEPPASKKARGSK